MENNKKPLYKRFWFIPLLVAVIITALLLLLAFRFYDSQEKETVCPFMSPCRKDPQIAQQNALALTSFFFSPLISLTWIINGIIILIKYYRKNHPKKPKEDNNVSTEEQTQPTQPIRPKEHITLPILAIIFSLIYMAINCSFYLPFIPVSTASYDNLWRELIFVFTSPLGITGLILSIVSIVKFRKRPEKTKTESIFNIINIIILIILSLPLLSTIFSVAFQLTS